MDKIVITIARGYGSGGRTLGFKLAKELGIPCYDRELVRMASDFSGISEEMFGAVDERVSSWKKFSGTKVYTGEVLPPSSLAYTSKDNLFALQAKAMKEVAEKESCVIIGRAADYVLKDRDDVIKLYFYAPLEDCIKRARDFHAESDEELMKRIGRIDKYRAQYYKYYTGREWNDSRNYDLCLNTSSMSYEKLVEVVKEYIRICK